MNKERLHFLLETELKPYIRKIDIEAFYPKKFLRKLANEGFFISSNQSQEEVLLKEFRLIKQISSYCLTTGFLVWCHLAALTFIRNTNNQKLKGRFLNQLEVGTMLAGTGLSNSMKHYGGLEKISLNALELDNGFSISGTLQSVSNLSEDNWFGAIASNENDQRIMFFVQCNAIGLSLKEKKGFLGVNGSATFSCEFKDVYIGKDQIIAYNADVFVQSIRSTFLSYQIPLGLGITEASLMLMNEYNKKEPNATLQKELDIFSQRTYQLSNELTNLFYDRKKLSWDRLISIRRQTVNLTLEVVHTTMIYAGGSGFIYDSAPSRKLRETYFFTNLTPTVKHLDNMMKHKKIPQS